MQNENPNMNVKSDEVTAAKPSWIDDMPPQPKREYTLCETVLAWVCVLVGYAFCRVFPVADSPLGGGLFVAALFIGAWVLALVRRVDVRPSAVIATVSALTVGSGLLLCDNAMLHTFAYGYAIVSFMYTVYMLFSTEPSLGSLRRLAAEYVKALVVLPFCSFENLFGALFTGRMKAGGKQVGKALLGVAIAVIPTAMVIGLLSYDEGFSKLLKDMFDLKLETVFAHIGSLILGVPVGVMLFGLFVSAVDGKGQDIMTEDGCDEAARKARIVPVLTVVAAALPLLFVYAVFFLSQWDYYVSAFTGVLPKGFSYADYAREGFFQLCSVAIINLVISVAAMLFMKRREDGNSVWLKLVVTLFSAGTWLLIATAISKMVLYIERYGLTPKRVYATWFMAVIALVFLVLVLGCFLRRLPTTAVCGIVTVAMFAALVLSGTDGLIANYNVDRYLDGSLRTVDVEAMEELGDAAIPSLVKLAEELDERNGTDISRPGQSAFKSTDETYKEVARYLADEASHRRVDDDTVWEWTIPSMRAERALKSIGLMK